MIHLQCLCRGGPFKAMTTSCWLRCSKDQIPETWRLHRFKLKQQRHLLFQNLAFLWFSYHLGTLSWKYVKIISWVKDIEDSHARVDLSSFFVGSAISVENVWLLPASVEHLHVWSTPQHPPQKNYGTPSQSKHISWTYIVDFSADRQGTASVLQSASSTGPLCQAAPNIWRCSSMHIRLRKCFRPPICSRFSRDTASGPVSQIADIRACQLIQHPYHYMVKICQSS